LVKCSECAKEVDEKKAAKLTIDGKRQYFHLHHVRARANCQVCGVELTKDEEFDGVCEECAFDEETEEFLKDWI
jgi:hypothetical protein